MKKTVFKIFLTLVALTLFGVLIYFAVTKAFNSKKSFVIEVEKVTDNQSENLLEENVVLEEQETDTELQEESIEKTESTIKNVEMEIEDEVIEKDEPAPQSTLSIKNNLVSWGFESPTEARTINSIIIHSSYDALGDDPYDVDGLVAEYKLYGVAAHYLIDREGTIHRLVADKNIAYHAGQSKTPDGKTGVNTFSIGIELMNTKDDEFTKKQYSSLNELLSQLKKTYEIKYTLGHDDIAPERKTDPWNFDWEKIDK